MYVVDITWTLSGPLHYMIAAADCLSGESQANNLVTDRFPVLCACSAYKRACRDRGAHVYEHVELAVVLLEAAGVSLV